MLWQDGCWQPPSKPLQLEIGRQKESLSPNVLTSVVSGLRLVLLGTCLYPQSPSPQQVNEMPGLPDVAHSVAELVAPQVNPPARVTWDDWDDEGTSSRAQEVCGPKNNHMHC